MKSLTSGCLLLSAIALAQNVPPDFPNLPPGFKLPKGADSRRQPRGRTNNGAQAKPAGVPIPLDSPPMQAFRRLEQQSVYHQRLAAVSNNPQFLQMMEQMGFGPSETTVAGDLRQVTMRMKIPAFDSPGQADDWEFRAVARDGHAARKMFSPAIPRLLALADREFARQMAQYNQVMSRTIAQSLASGPTGWISAGVASAAMAASNAMAAGELRKAHEFFEWQCLNTPNRTAVDKSAPPPLYDLRPAGEQSLDGIPVTTYEFYVNENGQSHGPVRMHVAKDSGLPARIEMNDPQMGGGFRVDYYDFNSGGDIEVPACLGGK